MTEEERRERLLKQVVNDPYNEVSGHELPDGGIEIMLSHRISMDDAVCIRIPPGDNIAFLYDDHENEERLDRTNTGGPWNAA